MYKALYMAFFWLRLSPGRSRALPQPIPALILEQEISQSLLLNSNAHN